MHTGDEEFALVEDLLIRVESALKAVSEVQLLEQQERKDLLQTMQQLVNALEETQQRIAVLEAAGQTSEAVSRRKLLTKVGKTIAWIIGPTATGGALYQALVQEEIYPGLKARLLDFLERFEEAEQAMDNWSSVGPRPSPVPTPWTGTRMAPEHTPQPSEARGSVGLDETAITKRREAIEAQLVSFMLTHIDCSVDSVVVWGPPDDRPFGGADMTKPIRAWQCANGKLIECQDMRATVAEAQKRNTQAYFPGLHEYPVTMASFSIVIDPDLQSAKVDYGWLRGPTWGRGDIWMLRRNASSEWSVTSTQPKWIS